jgi:hypothetical protein
MFNFDQARFGNISKDDHNVIIGNIGTGVDTIIVVYDLNKIMVGALHPVNFNSDPLPFTLLSDDDKARLRDALDTAIESQKLDPLWNTVLKDLGELVVSAQPIESANKFTFRDYKDTTHVTFFPEAPGPLPAGAHSRLDYKGPEGSFTFVRDQITSQDSPLGLLITVALEKSIDSGALTFTLVLPPVNMAGKKKQAFDTVAIKTKSFGILPREGAKLVDTAICLESLAEIVILPL